MSFPNPALGPFEAENNDWAQHLMRNFSTEVTQPLLHQHHAAQLALAHLTGFIVCAMSDASDRGKGEQVMADVLDETILRLKPLFAGTIGITILPGAGPILTVVPGGKGADPEPDGVA
ncbi:hypothetical protein MPLA_290064 [Mesorhizobium sp. ORS 3359]|nr:hypothetical protein MPLA_290064 [Mesorhizobium sp. ORS 3359]